MRALTFDLATSTGWATGSDVAGIDGWGKFVLPRTYEDVGLFCWFGRREVRRLIERYNPDIVGFCTVLLNAHDNPMKLRKLYGLPNVVEEEVVDFQRTWKRKIECLEVRESRVRQHFLGAGNVPGNRKALKIATKVQCRARGWDVDGDDEADALALCDFTLALHSESYARMTAAALARA